MSTLYHMCVNISSVSHVFTKYMSTLYHMYVCKYLLCITEYVSTLYHTYLESTGGKCLLCITEYESTLYHMYVCKYLLCITRIHRVRVYSVSHGFTENCSYGVATISRLLKIVGLFCKRALQKRPIFSKETYNFKEPTNRSHPISHVFTE